MSGTPFNGDKNTGSGFYNSSTELDDLGRERFDRDTAAIGDRDYSLFAPLPVNIRQGRAPVGYEARAHEWKTLQYTTEDRNDREELKGDLHEGQLHRQNRVAGRAGNDMLPLAPMIGHGRGGLEVGGRGGKRGRGGRQSEDGGRGEQVDVLCAARKPDYPAPPQAKGFPEELDKSMFWNEPIV